MFVVQRVPAVLWRYRYLLAYGALAGWLIAHTALSRDAATGFTRLILFGDRIAQTRISRLRDVPVFTYRRSVGYDGQFYAQIAVVGNPFDRELRTALDLPPYRAERILLPVLAHLAGLGRPAWVLTAYALANVACWLLLAWVTERWWFPASSFHNLLRWTGTLFSAGMLASVVRSLTDGPALLVLALGIRCVETHRRTLAALLFGAAGLVREVCVVAATTLMPTSVARRSWLRDTALAAASVLPVAIWMCVLWVHYRVAGGGLSSNFGPPLRAAAGGWLTILAKVRAGHWATVRDDAYVAVAVLVQAAFVLARPRPANAWWRVGAAFALLAVFMGPAPWEDPHWAVQRHLLPLTLAFNVLVPRTRAGLALLAAGNLTVLSAPSTLRSAPDEQTAFVDGITCDFASGWYGMERTATRTWRWSFGRAEVMCRNPTPRAATTQVDFDLESRTDRMVTIDFAGAHAAISLSARQPAHVRLGPLDFAPGDSLLEIDSTDPGWREPGTHGRTLSVSLQHLMITASR